VELGGGPGELALAVVVEADVRARRREVEVLLRIDMGELTAVVAVDQVAHGACGGVARIVPAGKSGYEHRIAQRRALVPPDVTHGHMLEAPSTGSARPRRASM
jgi:hypothetical protein